MRVNLNSINSGRTLELAQISRLLLIAAPSALFEGLARAIDDRLPLVRAEVHQKLPDAEGRDYAVRLVLLHHDGLGNTVDMAGICAKRFPNAAVALLVADMCADCTERERMFQDALVQGVLPLTLKLDVWIAAVSMLLNGGEFYPAVRAQKAVKPTQNQTTNGSAVVSETLAQSTDLLASTISPSHNQQSKASLGELPPLPDALPRSEMARTAPQSRILEGLTGRERQILELVSEGYQNKLIAHRISLSEHTVKVHVHNLLTKLRVTNRTQAAAAFRLGLIWTDAPGFRPRNSVPAPTEVA